MGNKTRIAVLEARLDEREKNVAIALAARDKAIEIASQALTTRLEHSNGLIAQMKERDAEKASKTEVGQVLERVQTLERGASAGAGRAAGMGAIVALVISLAALVAAFWKHL